MDVRENEKVTFDEFEERERVLIRKIEDLKHLCFGMYAQIVPDNFKTTPKNVVVHVVKGIAEEIAIESVGIGAEEKKLSFLSSFYETVIYFLLSMCNEEDQILLSLRKLADTFNTEEQEPLQETIFDTLISNVKSEIIDGDSGVSTRRRMYAENCLRSYETFQNYYEECMRPVIFRSKVRNGVNSYADKCGYSGIASEKMLSKIIQIIDEARNEVHFALYQDTET